MNENILDYVVIGGGIAGLYSNYKLAKKGLDGILLEKESDFGGRVYEMNWHGSIIKLGAGIMADHNHQLLELLSKLKIKVSSFNSDVKTWFGYQFDMNQAIKQIKSKYKQEKYNIEGLTMKQFLVKYFKKKFADQFIENCEYRDFLESDPGYFIKYYTIDDMSHDSYKVLIIRWGELVEKLVLPNCKSNNPVISIKKSGNNFIVKTKESSYLTKQIYLALTLKPLDKLIKNLIDFKYSDYIGTVKFARIYTYHSKPYDLGLTSLTSLSNYNLVPGPLQKIIKISPNILMVSYSDGVNAKYWKTKTQIKKVETALKKLEHVLQNQNVKLNITKIDDIEIGYWDEGVHYYKPVIGTSINKLINRLSKPAKNIYVVGEIISKKQGWVEGAIESVNRII
jgi:monoamine oxidase